MKSINLIENNKKDKKSKIKEAFKKIGEFTLIAATAFTLSCGGTETNAPEEKQSMFTGEVKEYIDQNNFSEFDIFDKDFEFIYDNKPRPELSPFKDLFVDICSQNYNGVNYDDIYGMGILNFNESEIKEVILRASQLHFGTEGIFTEDNTLMYTYSGFNELGRTYLQKFKYVEENMDWTKYGVIQISSKDFEGYKYLSDLSLLEKNPQYFLACNYAYDSSLEKPIAILRVVLVPKDILDKKIEDNGLSMELFYERVEAN